MFSLAKLPGLQSCNMRIQVVQHLPAVISFLSTCKTEEIEILGAEEVPGQASGMFFFRKGDGTVFGWSLYTQAFPNLATPKPEDDLWWKVPTKSLTNGLKGVFAGLKGGKEEQPIVQFSRPDPQGPLLLTVVTDSSDSACWDIEVLESGQSPECPQMPESFQLSRAALDILLKAVKGDTLTLGVNYRAATNKGYVRVLESRGDKGDEFLFMLAWWRDQA
jgi:hypothetical protein